MNRLVTITRTATGGVLLGPASTTAAIVIALALFVGVVWVLYRVDRREQQGRAARARAEAQTEAEETRAMLARISYADPNARPHDLVHFHSTVQSWRERRRLAEDEYVRRATINRLRAAAEREGATDDDEDNEQDEARFIG